MFQHPFTIRPHGATSDHLRMWCDWGKKNGCDYLIVMCDESVWEDYPIFCTENEWDEVISERCIRYKHCIREVYSFFESIEEQLSKHRVMNTPDRRRKKLNDSFVHSENCD